MPATRAANVAADSKYSAGRMIIADFPRRYAEMITRVSLDLAAE
jgi:hypothetical protein